jgi:DnaJ-class molecular chaperone
MVVTCPKCNGSGNTDGPTMTSGCWVRGEWCTGMKRACRGCDGAGYVESKEASK